MRMRKSSREIGDFESPDGDCSNESGLGSNCDVSPEGLPMDKFAATGFFSEDPDWSMLLSLFLEAASEL